MIHCAMITFESAKIWAFFHWENGGTLGMVPLIINPIYYTPYIVGYLVGLSSFKGLQQGGV